MNGQDDEQKTPNMREERGEMKETPPAYNRPGNDVDDAFGFRPQQPDTGYNAAVPPARTQYRAAKKNDVAKRILLIALALVLAVGIFFAGFYTRFFTMTEQARIFDWAMRQIDAYYIGDDVEGLKAGVKADLDQYLKGLEDNLDPYSGFYTPAELEKLEQELQGKNRDMGLRIKGVYTSGPLNGFDVHGALAAVAVHSVVYNSPADQAGLQADDILYQIDGVNVDVANLDGTMYDKLEGDAPVSVTVKRPRYTAEGMAYDVLPAVTLQKMEYDANYMRYYSELPASEGGENILSADTAYLKFIGFQGNANAEFKNAMDAFLRDGKKNLILDLRDNGGGYLDLLQYIASYLVPASGGKGVSIMVNEYKDKSQSAIYSDNRLYDEAGEKVLSKNEGWYDGMGFQKIVVLVNSGTASASEVLLAAMADYGTVDAVIGTEKTYGKGIGQSTFVNGNYALTITTMRWRSPKGTWVQKRYTADGTELGRISPTVLTTRNERNYPYAPEKDQDILAAIQAING